MKRIVIAAGLVALAAAPALSDINPLGPGLPSFTVTAGQGMDGVVSPGFPAANRGNNASTMCVECHSVNPSPHITAPSNGIDETSNTNWATHTVLNDLTSTAYADYTNSGGGFSGAFGGAARDGGEYAMKVAFPTTGGFSKWFLTGSNPIQSINANTVGNWANADLICESCHNVIRNDGNQLLLDNYADSVDDALCVLCHDGGANNAASYADFHNNDNLINFNRTARKRHHVLTADVLAAASYDPDGNDASNDSIMWAPSFSNKLDNGWCGAGKFANINPAIVLDYGATIAFRDACNVGGSGTRAFGSLNAGADIIAQGAGIVNCSNCHRPHNAKSGAGAFIFRTGGVADYAGNIGASGTVAGTIGYGIRRQADVGDWTTTKVYREYVGLCNGCHQGYGQ